MALRKGFRQLVDEAKSRITTIGLEQAGARHVGAPVAGPGLLEPDGGDP